MSDQTQHKAVLRVRYLVWITIILVMALILVSLIPGVNGAINLPYSEATTALFIIIGSYVGIDQLAAVVKSSTELVGNPYNENKSKLFRICIALFILLIEAHVIQLFTPIELPLKDFWIGYGIILAEFVAGQKGKLAANGIQTGNPAPPLADQEPNEVLT